MYRRIKDLKFTFKKLSKIANNRNTPAIKLKRKMVCKYILNLHRQKRNIVYVDETGFKFNNYTNHGFAEKGKSAYINSLPISKNYSTAMAMSDFGILGFMLFDGSCKSIDFMGFLYKMIQSDSQNFENKRITFFMDNASILKSKVFKNQFMNSHSVLYNVPYSPQLNPIELAFSIIKRDIKAKNSKSLKSLVSCIIKASKKVNTIIGWSLIRHTLKFLAISLKGNFSLFSHIILT